MLAAHLMICYSVFSVTRNLWSEDDCHFLYQVYLQLNMDLYFDWIWLNCKSDAETLTELAMTCFVFLCSEFSQSSQPRSACSKELLSSTVIVQRNLANAYSAFTLVMASCHRAIGSMPSWDTEVTSYSACFGWLLLQTQPSGFVFLIIWLLLLGFHERQNLCDISLFCIQLSCTVVNSVSS